MDRSSRQKIKATEILNDTIEELDLIDIFRTLHPKKPKYLSKSQPKNKVLSNRPDQKSERLLH